MAGPLNSKSLFFFLISLSLLFLSPSYSTSPIDPIPHEKQDASVTSKDLLLSRLEELVKNLTEVVARLDARLSEKGKNEISNGKSKDEIKEDSEEIRAKAKAFSVTKYSPFWSERFGFTSAVKLDSDATCINVLPFKDHEGLSKYFAIGDSRGRIYVFLRNGDVLIEFFTTSDSPVTAMVSYFSVYKNQSYVVTGHQNGELLLHRIQQGSFGEDLNSALMENVGKFDGTGDGENGLQVTLLELHHVGRVRYVLATDFSGKLTVFTENGAVYGSVMPVSRPLVFLKQRLMFLTETGAGSLDLRSMKIRESKCEGLNNSLARTYVFDSTERSKAYGFTSDGEIIHVLLLGDLMNFKCRVRSKKKFQIQEPVALQAIKGYLLVVTEEKVFVYNISTQHYVRTVGPKLLFSAGLEEIRSGFLDSVKTGQGNVKVTPLIASDREKLLVIGLGDGYIATYKSKLVISKGEFNTMLWSSPVFFFILFLFAAWHFFANKKEALTAWGPDDPFTVQNNSSTERSFAEQSRINDDIMDLRRRYVSPSRYSPSYRSIASNDTANYRTTELKYRGGPGGSGLDSSGISNRRESLFGNNKAVDDDS